MSCADVREELGGYVLGALEQDERAAVAAHLGACAGCTAERDRIAGLPALLEHADGLEIPVAPAAVEERVLDRIAQERGAAAQRRPRLTWRRSRALLAGGLAGAALGAGVTAVVVGGEDAPQRPDAYQLVMTGAAGVSARAELSPAEGGTAVHLWVKGLPPGEEVVYEVLCERSGWSASAGTFRADARGSAYAALTTAARVGEYERIRIVRRSDDAPILTGQLN